MLAQSELEALIKQVCLFLYKDSSVGWYGFFITGIEDAPAEDVHFFHVYYSGEQGSSKTLLAGPQILWPQF